LFVLVECGLLGKLRFAIALAVPQFRFSPQLLPLAHAVLLLVELSLVEYLLGLALLVSLVEYLLGLALLVSLVEYLLGLALLASLVG
jgi:hypothetical protein